MTETAPNVLSEKRGAAGIITLNRPKALNALNQEMAVEIHRVLREWQFDDEVSLVIIRGAGDRAFCAGGDIAAMYHNAAERPAANDAFFRDEYALDEAIAQYPKPYVALMDGIVLGGGLGLSAHASHRIVTERSRIGMPEVAIGLFPDCGVAWELARAPHHLGRHLALTGVHVGAADAIEAGLADTFVPAERLDAVVDKLAQTGDVSVIDEFAAGQPSGGLDADREQLAAAYEGSAEEILANLRGIDADWARAAAKAISAGCPASVQVALEAQHRAATMTLSEVFAQDFSLARAMHRRPDFREGVRAQIIDKDRNPSWQPAVTPAELSAIFDYQD